MTDLNPSQNQPANETPLQGWKEIAAYLDIAKSTRKTSATWSSDHLADSRVTRLIISSSASASRRLVERRRLGLQERKDTLNEAYIFDKSIDKNTYDRQLVKIGEDLSDVERALESEAQNLNINRIVEFSKAVLCDPSRYWRAADLEGKRRFQATLCSAPTLLEPLRRPLFSGP